MSTLLHEATYAVTGGTPRSQGAHTALTAPNKSLPSGLKLMVGWLTGGLGMRASCNAVIYPDWGGISTFDGPWP